MSSPFQGLRNLCGQVDSVKLSANSVKRALERLETRQQRQKAQAILTMKKTVILLYAQVPQRFLHLSTSISSGCFHICFCPNMSVAYQKLPFRTYLYHDFSCTNQQRLSRLSTNTIPCTEGTWTWKHCNWCHLSKMSLTPWTKISSEEHVCTILDQKS